MKALIGLLLLAASLLQVTAISLPDGPQVGQAAPTLKLSKWLQAPPEAALGWPTNKVVVLEFWDTACGGCVVEIPHLNELADEFKDKPVQFISVTGQKESVIQRFLKKTPIKGWLGLGPDGGMGENTTYKVMGIPHTVLIDAHGRIATITDPFELRAPMIQACLDGTLGAPASGQSSSTNKASPTIVYWSSGNGQLPGMIPAQYLAGIKPLFQVMIQPTQTNSAPKSLLANLPPRLYRSRVETWIIGEALTLQNDPLERAIEVVYNVKSACIVTEDKLPKDKYDFYVTIPPVNQRPQSPAAFEAVFARAVAATFGLTVNRETRDIEVLVLKTNNTSMAALSKSTDPDKKYFGGWNEAAATNQPVSVLAEELENSSAKLVFDETGLKKNYDFDIKWEQKDWAHPNIPGIIAAVKSLGLELVYEKRPMHVIVVRKSQ